MPNENVHLSSCDSTMIHVEILKFYLIFYTHTYKTNMVEVVDNYIDWLYFLNILLVFALNIWQLIYLSNCIVRLVFKIIPIRVLTRIFARIFARVRDYAYYILRYII